jgi:hypothetical protein
MFSVDKFFQCGMLEVRVPCRFAGAVMQMKDLPFVHLLLFTCKQCNRPLAIPMASEEGNLERVDGGIFDVSAGGPKN